MGSDGSSSRRKSSRKKSSKNYSKVSLKKKIRRKESKRRRLRHDSVSSYSDDDSLKSASISTFISESDHKSRKNKYKKIRHDYSNSSDDYSMSSASDSLSSLHKDYTSKKTKSSLQRRRKRALQRSVSPHRDKDSHHVRKRKRSRRSHDVKPRKKSLKKSKRHTRVISSSDSLSCSTCQSNSSRSDRTTGTQRAIVIPGKEIEKGRGRDGYKVHRKRKVRSPCCSSCSRDSDHSISHSEEVVATLNNPRRLRSVIAVIEQPQDKEENKWKADPNKEEIVYNHDDFPSPKSIESDDVGCKGDSVYHSHGESSKKSQVETLTGEEVTTHSLTRMDGSDRKNNTLDTKSNKDDSNNFEKKKITDVSVSVTGLGGDDLESILRQKALENLRKFRGGLQKYSTANLKNDNENDSNKHSGAGAETIQNNSTKQHDSPDVLGCTGDVDHTKSPTSKGKLSLHNKIEKDNIGHEDFGKQFSNNKKNATNASDGAALPTQSQNEDCSTAHASIVNPASNAQCNPVTVVHLAKASTAAIAESTSGEHASKNPQSEAKDSSQFEQKKMSVMRGGEMVEVSYKVYIPKRAPALARRPLRR